ncbi:TPA: IS66 family insertion sequence element accessory protein TnpB, partial [Escherichia coli]
MISLPSGTRIWLVAGVTDMRKSFNGLGEQVQHVLNDNPFPEVQPGQLPRTR